jgi:MFS superfamily sulfate permease-like transporter
MLAAIGVIIVSKQIHITLGVNDVGGEPLELLAEIPRSLTRLNPEIALIGLLSLVILFGLPLIRNRWIGRIPGPMLVLLVTVPIGMAFDLTHDHFYTLAGHRYHLGEEYLVAIPGNLFAAITTPRFDALAGWAGWKWVILFALVGSVESLLSAKAVEMIDPDRRKTDLNRDLLAIGVGNVASAAIGGLPMISEIVRSKANADSGAQTRFANLYHGLFLLGFVALLPGLIHQIPLAALSAMLVYTGARLASPREFQNVFRIGKEQLVIFLVTMVGVLATDLLVGVAFGIAVKLSIHVLNGVPLRSLFKPYLRIEQRGDGTSVIVAKDSAVFSNWIPFKHQIEQIGLNQRNNLVVDLSETKLIDHSVMEKLHELQEEFGREGLSLELAGLESHRKLSGHDFSARRGGLTRIRRLTLVCPTGVTDEILSELARCGASGYTITDCRGSGRSTVLDGSGARNGMVRIEVLIAPEKVDGVEALIRKRLRSGLPMTASFETVSVVRPDHF